MSGRDRPDEAPRRVVDERPDVSALFRDTADPSSGALVVLTAGGTGGRDRADGGAGPDGRPARDPDAPAGPGREELERAAREIEERARERFGVRRCRLRLCPGAPSGETAAAVAVRAPHRAAAFEAARWALDAALDRRGPPA